MTTFSLTVCIAYSRNRAPLQLANERQLPHQVE
jgi:hypothetical protein